MNVCHGTQRFVGYFLGAVAAVLVQACVQWIDVGVECGPVKTECCPCPSEQDCPDGPPEIPEKCFHPSDGDVDGWAVAPVKAEQ